MHGTGGEVLLVEDEEDLRVSMEMALTEGEFAVTAVASGAQALQRLLSQAFNVVLTDVNMPGMSGIELLIEIHRINPSLPVIVMSAKSENLVLARASGANATLGKPFDMSDLTSCLAKFRDHGEHAVMA